MKSSRLLVAMLLIGLILPLFINLGDAESPTPVVWSDKKEYDPSSTTYLFGYGFNSFTQINVTIVRPDLVEDKLQTMTDEFGYFSCQYALDGIHGTFNVIATDGVNVATTTFNNHLYLNAWWDSHESCLGISAQAGGLRCYRSYYIKYFDPTGVEKRQSPTYTGVNSFSDNLVIPPTFPNILGWWTVRLYENGAIKRTKYVYIDRMVWTTDSTYNNMVTSFAQGETVYFKTIGLKTSKYYRFKLEMPNGTRFYVGSWTTGVTSMTGSYSLPLNAPLGTWEIHVREAYDASGTCEKHYVDCHFEVTTAPPPQQHYLTVQTDPTGIGTIPGEGWYNACTLVNLTAPASFPNTTGTRYRFDYWDVDGVSQGGGVDEISVHMDASHTATAYYIVQYYFNLTANPQGITIPSGTGWYDTGASASVFTAEFIGISPGASRYRFDGWTTGDMSEIANASATSTTVLMDKPKTVVANYVVQYHVTFDQIGLDSTASGTVVTIDGSPYTYGDLSYDFWVDEGTVVTYSYGDTISSSVSGKRFILTSVTGSSSPITVTSQVDVTGNYKTQYYLTVTSPYGVPGGEGWYDSGDTAYGTLDTGTVDHGNGTRRVFTHWSGGASGTNYIQSDPIIMDGPKTATANWKTQYYLTVSSTHGATGGSGWYDSGNTAFATVSPLSVSGPTGTQYVFTHWSGDASGTTSPSEPITMDGPKTAVANWKTQYYLTVFSDHGATGGSGWYDSGATAYATVNPLIVPGPAGAQYVFTNWSGDASGTTSPSNPIVMNSPKTAAANWKTQYEVTFDQTGVGTDFTGTVVTIDASNYGVGDLPTSFWWDSGTSHSFSFASPLVVNATMQYDWFSTSGLSTLQTDTLTITGTGTVTGHYTSSVKYQVTFDQTGVGSDFGGTIVTVDGTPYNWASLPVSFLWSEGSIHTFAFDSPLVVTPNTKQYVWDSTSGLSSLQSDSITISQSGSVIGNYKTQYYLTMSTNFGTVSPGDGWHDAGSIVSISATPPTTVSGERYVWNGWTGAGTGSYTGLDNPTSITMNSPITEAASWTHQYYLTVTSPYDTPGGEGWYDSGDTSHATLATDVIDHSNGTRRVFTHWSGDASGTDYASSNAIIMDGPKTAVANWKTQYYLTVDTDPTGLSPAPTPSSNWYDESTDVVLTGPDPSYLGIEEYKFVYWDIDSVSQGNGVNPITVHMDMPHSATAHYEPEEYTLTVNIVGSGSVAKDPDQTTYSHGTVVELTADPDPCWAFSHWSGDLTSSSNPETITMDGDKTVTAHFTQIEYTLTITSTSGGTTNPVPDSYEHPCGSSVQVTAIPDSCYEFDHWELDTVDVGSSNPYTVHMDDDHTLHTVFTQAEYTLTVNVVGSGSVTKNPDQATYPCDTVVTLTAVPDSEWVFSYWSGDLSGSVNPKTIIMNSDKTVTAHFTEEELPPSPECVGGEMILFKVDKPSTQSQVELMTLFLAATVASIILIRRKKGKATKRTL